jgi:hypothetical protein
MPIKKAAPYQQLALPGIPQLQPRNVTPVAYYIIIAVFILFAGDVAV